MSTDLKSEQLIIPVYINEKIVLDMLAIMEDGFSTVSQISYTEHKEDSSAQKLDGGLSTSSSILSKLLRINLSGELSHAGDTGESKSVVQERVHTNVSLLSKFRSHLVKEKILKSDFDVRKIQVGDFIEIKGKLDKNPLIDCMDLFVGFLNMANIFADKPQVGNKTQAKNQQQQNQELMWQIKSFSDELRHSGTVDFILSDEKGTIVLSAQEQYLANDNISELLGGRFKVLGKVIAICKDETENIDLLRKTNLSILSEELLSDMFSGFRNQDTAQFNLPELRTKIAGPAMIVIPIAIYA